MAATTYRSAAGAGASTSTNVTVTKPTGVVSGDLMIAVSTTDQDGSLAALTAPAGWSTIGSYAQATVGFMKVWQKIAGGSEPANYTFNDSSGSDSAAAILAFSAYETGTPIWSGPNFTGSANATSTHVAPSATGITGGINVVAWFGGASGSATRSYSGMPAGYTERTDNAPNGWVVLATATAASTTGATGTKSATCSGSIPYIGMQLVVNANVRYGTPTATAVTVAASSTGGKKLTRTAPATAVSLATTPTGQKKGIGAPSAPLTLGTTIKAGRYVARSVSATALTLSTDPRGSDVVPVTATPVTLGATRTSNKIGMGSPSASAMSFAGSGTGFKIGMGHPSPVLNLSAAAIDPVKTGGQPVPITRPALPPLKQPLRLMAQDILSKKWLDWDLPVNDVQLQYNLSGPDLITGYFNPEIKSIRDLGLDAWATYIHAEIDGQIRASGILQPIHVEEEKLSFEAMGPCGYAHGIPFLGTEYAGIQVDPLDIVRVMWAHVQSYPEGNLGLILDPTVSPVRLGEPETPKIDPETGQIVYKKDSQGNITTEPEMDEAKPYSLMWWDLVDIGSEVDNLAKATPFDYYDEAVWNAGRTDVVHKLRLAYPRKGTRRFDLRFCQGENILDLVPTQEKDDTFASAVIIIGAGEGRDAIRGYTGERYLNRLRRVAFSSQKNIKSAQAANALAQEELRSRRGRMLEFAQIIIDAQHPNAKVGEYQTGDDIFVQVDVPWLGDLGIWHRITGYTYDPTRELVTMTLARSDSFRYGSSI